MARNRASAKAAGRVFELNVGRYIEARTGRPVERRRLRGSKDAGDLAGVKTADGRDVAIECKNTARIEIAKWIREVELERYNADAKIGAVVFKRPSVSDRKVETMGGQAVAMYYYDFYQVFKTAHILPDIKGLYQYEGKYLVWEWMSEISGQYAAVGFRLAGENGWAYLMTLETFTRLLGATEEGEKG